MTNPINAKKQMVITSLNALHKARIRAMHKLNAVKQDRRYLRSEHDKVLADLMSIERKILWEVNNHQGLLNG